MPGECYVFGVVGGDYTVVCKQLSYKFMRPCLGPAVYRMKARENIAELVASGKEFNITLDLEILQQGFRPNERDRRVGQCEANVPCNAKDAPQAKSRARSCRDVGLDIERIKTLIHHGCTETRRETRNGLLFGRLDKLLIFVTNLLD